MLAAGRGGGTGSFCRTEELVERRGVAMASRDVSTTTSHAKSFLLLFFKKEALHFDFASNL
jgi:hypothetical protein